MHTRADWELVRKEMRELADPHVNERCARWLVGVEGVGQKPGAQQDAEMEFAAMYPDFLDGENLSGARVRPIRLRDQTRLVYMPHTHGPGVRSLPYMETDDFPENTEQVWAEHFLTVTVVTDSSNGQ